MRQHVNSLHGLKNFEMEAECSIVYGQTWFSGTKAVWWQVASPVPEAVVGTDGNRTAGLGPSPLHDTLVEELLRVETEQITAEEQQRWHLQEQHNSDQVSPWLQTTGWLDVFANRLASFADLVQLVRAPSLEETRLQLLAELLNDYIIPRCLDTLCNTPHPYRTWLKSPQEEVDQPKPFMEPQDSRTLKKYTRYWVQYICFIIRSIADHLAESESEDDSFLEVAEPYATLAGLYLTSQQYFCLRQMHCLLLHTADQSMEELEDDLHLESPYKSSLMYFLAHMGIDAGRNTFSEPQTYTSILASVLYVSRLFVLEYTLSASGWPILDVEAHENVQVIDHEPVTEETLPEKSTMKAFQVERKNWLVQGKNTPIAALLRLLAYGKMVNRMQEKLLLGKNSGLDLDKIQDSISCEGLWGKKGHNFTCHPANNLPNSLGDMLYCAAEQRGGRNLLEEEIRCIECADEPNRQDQQEEQDRQDRQDGQDGSERATQHKKAHQQLLKWKSKPCKDYLQLEREFLDLLLIAVRPFAIAMERQVVPNFNAQRDGSTTRRSKYLWIGSKDPFSDQYVNRLFKRTMQQYLGLMLNFSDYRHIAIAILRKFLQPHCAVLGINAESSLNTSANKENLEAAEEKGNLILDLQAAHTTHTAEQAYATNARFLNKLSERLLRQFLHASIAWHDWLNMGSKSAPFLQTAKRSCSDTSALELPASAMTKRQALFKLAVHGSMPSIRAGPNSEEIQMALQKLHGPQAKFLCKAQAKSVEFLASCSKSTASIHILGTGQCKSLFFFLLASLAQMRTRALPLGLRAAQWTPGKASAKASLVFVSADLVLLPEFIQYGHTLAVNQQLKHIFLDECHVALTNTSYRENLQYLGNLRLIDAPLACLTATLPPALEERLQQQLCLGKTTVLRNSTVQKNIQYRVVYCHKH
ncbi:MAG: hypothetical protein M1829_001493, partial [Trizodia sp. TS-e1964]